MGIFSNETASELERRSATMPFSAVGSMFRKICPSQRKAKRFDGLDERFDAIEEIFHDII